MWWMFLFLLFFKTSLRGICIVLRVLMLFVYMDPLTPVVVISRLTFHPCPLIVVISAVYLSCLI